MNEEASRPGFRFDSVITMGNVLSIMCMIGTISIAWVQLSNLLENHSVRITMLERQEEPVVKLLQTDQVQSNQIAEIQQVILSSRAERNAQLQGINDQLRVLANQLMEVETILDLKERSKRDGPVK